MKYLMNTNFKFLQNLFLSLLMGVSICVIQACSDSDNENDIEEVGDYSYIELENGDFLVNGHLAVDLGLSVKWASCNVGAKSSDEPGNFFAWGETATKTCFNWDNYKWLNQDKPEFLKYLSEGSQLSSADDAATVRWGKGWRMPTEEEVNELISLCTSTPKIDKVYVDGGYYDRVVGYEITGPSGKSIFIPYSGYYSGYYSSFVKSDQYTPYFWTSTGGGQSAFAFVGSWIGADTLLRDCGLPIRPVVE